MQTGKALDDAVDASIELARDIMEEGLALSCATEADRQGARTTFDQMLPDFRALLAAQFLRCPIDDDLIENDPETPLTSR